MTFIAPIWLLALLPWLAVTVFLLVGRRKRVRIPFVELWKVPIDTPKPKKRIGPPPIGLVFTMIAMLVAIIAAGQPSLRGAGTAGEIVVIVDRGISMSAGQRYVAGARHIAEVIRKGNVAAPMIDLHFVPPLDRANAPLTGLTVDAFLAHVEAASPTARDTGVDLDSAIAELRTGKPGRIIVISDRKSVTADDAIIQVAPADTIRNAAITNLVARRSPKAQVMVEVETIGTMSDKAELTVSTAGENATQTIDLPKTGTSKAFFFDFQNLGPTVDASLDVADDFIADNRAWLVERGSWPRLEPQAGVSAAVDRVIRLYSSARPPNENSLRIPIVSASDRLTAGSPGIVVDGRAATQPATKREAAQLADHPVTKDVRWDDLTAAQIAADAPKGDWTPIVRFGDRVLVAVREMPARQVWIGFESPAWQRSADFVVFWANVFESVGRGGPVYSSETVGDVTTNDRNGPKQRVEGLPRPIAPETVTPAEWPGLYRRGDGFLQAVNSAVSHSEGAFPTNWQDRLKNLPLMPSGTNLTPWFLLMSMGLMILAACAWKRSSLTGFSGTFTVAKAEKTVDEAGPGSTGMPAKTA